MQNSFDIAASLLRAAKNRDAGDIDSLVTAFNEKYPEISAKVLEDLRILSKLQPGNVEVASASDLSVETKMNIAEKLNLDVKDILFTVNKDLVAGIVIKNGDKVVDSSLAKYIEGLKQKIEGADINSRSENAK